MQVKSQQAFTMLELVFVIVVIGILSAIALPRFGDTANSAYTTKAQALVATVRSALTTERQRRILRGDFTPITDLRLSATGAATANAFDHFSGDAQVPPVFTPVVDYPVRACSTPTQRACWVAANPAYSYRFADASMATTGGQADFRLNAGRFECTAADTADCNLITQ